jgi:hypothetical protein
MTTDPQQIALFIARLKENSPETNEFKQVAATLKIYPDFEVVLTALLSDLEQPFGWPQINSYYRFHRRLMSDAAQMFRAMKNSYSGAAAPLHHYSSHDVEADGYPRSLPTGFDELRQKLGLAKPSKFFTTQLFGPPGYRPNLFYELWRDAHERGDKGLTVTLMEMPTSLQETAAIQREQQAGLDAERHNARSAAVMQARLPAHLSARALYVKARSEGQEEPSKGDTT